ncbi:MAG: GntR family transcriptional regulator [Spirochaetales bacterium]|uniref:GntR family transcriptional regulator n=1 Tax=Candidatus Thalassospirochaeta sargassi TaxID=3119039 RepID=A0AAJ1I9Q3_9SPIO|nr:GntR family transcriptional regulator [Spirochaetales bacterium]
MEFKDGKAIYLQIADYISENILQGKWKGGDRIASVREFAVDIEVNPNTVMRAYSYLQDEGIIYNKRGIGYFVGEDSMEKVMTLKKEDFISKELPYFFRILDMLNIDFDGLKAMYDEYRRERSL